MDYYYDDYDYYDYDCESTESVFDYHSLNISYYNISSPEIYLRAPWADNLVIVDKEYVVPFLLTVKNAEMQEFEYFSDMYAIDNFDGLEYRFSVVYRIYNPFTHTSLSAIVYTQEGCSIASIQDVYTSSCWAEREAWEMLGVYFEGHRSLQRLLTDYNFKGHPLRRDFPVVGYVECFFTYHLNLIEFVKSEYMQECRIYEFYDGWDEDGVNDNTSVYANDSLQDFEIDVSAEYNIHDNCSDFFKEYDHLPFVETSEDDSELEEEYGPQKNLSPYFLDALFYIDIGREDGLDRPAGESAGPWEARKY